MKIFITKYSSKILIKKLILLKIFLFLLILTPLKAQIYLGNYSSNEIKGEIVTVNADTSSIKFIFYQPDIVKVQYLPSPSTAFDSSLVIIQDTTLSVSLSVNEDDSAFSISSSSLKVVCNKNPLRVSYYDESGKLLLAEPASGGLEFNNQQRIANFSLNSNDHFYGTGERGTSLDKRGLAFDSFNEQIGGYTGALPTMNINVPLLASTNGYAIYFEDTYPGHFDLGNSNPNIYSYTANGGELCYFFIAAPTIQNQLEKYTWLTGRQPLPPRWAFGYIQSKYGYRNETAAAQMIQTMRQNKIPCDAIILDLYWYKNMGDVSWDLSNWPDPAQMMNNFLSEGIKTIVISEPYITQSSSNFPYANSSGYFAKDENENTYIINNWWSCGCDAALIDMTNPTVQSWWWSKYPLFMDTVMAGLWTDLSEPENDNSSMKFYLGSRDKIHNIYDLLWAKTLFNGFKQFRPNQRIFNLTRSGYAGIQRYGAIFWSGDVGKNFGGLAIQIPMLLNMGMSGLAYHNSDIGGFTNGYTTPELYTRWMQYGTFCPITRAHGYDGIQNTEPWTFDSSTTAICKKYIQLRYQLLPYIYTMAYNNYGTGIPLARPLLFDDPNNSRLLNESSSYFWGDNFIVSPVVISGQTSKSIYLPQGIWIDYWNHQQYPGGQSITISTPIDKLPLFVKAGSVSSILN
jgi:alpha-glucosidase (family GH31 glycosyl hydrolase)